MSWPTPSLARHSQKTIVAIVISRNKDKFRGKTVKCRS